MQTLFFFILDAAGAAAALPILVAFFSKLKGLWTWKFKMVLGSGFWYGTAPYLLPTGTGTKNRDRWIVQLQLTVTADSSDLKTSQGHSEV